jgi:hypothetical protein
MKRLLSAALVSVFLLAAAGAAHAQAGSKNQPPPPIEVVAPRTESPVSAGRLEDGTYTNDYFGLTFSTPWGWVAQDMAARQAILDSGKKIFEGGTGSAKEKAGIDASLQRTVFLLSVSKYELTSVRPDFNAQMSFLAERVPTAVIKTGEDYMTQMIRVARGSAAKLELTGPIRAEKVGGVSFAVADAKLTIGAAAAQKYYATVRKGYALLFAFTYADEADVKTFEELIKSVRFK